MTSSPNDQKPLLSNRPWPSGVPNGGPFVREHQALRTMAFGLPASQQAPSLQSSLQGVPTCGACWPTRMLLTRLFLLYPSAGAIGHRLTGSDISSRQARGHFSQEIVFQLIG